VMGWEFSDEARDAGRDAPDLDEKALTIEREFRQGRDAEGRLYISMGPTRERLAEIAKADPLWARYLDGDR